MYKKINKPNTDKLKESDKCSINGLKILPFIIRSFKESVCDIQSGVMNNKLLQSSIIVILKGNKTIVHLPTNFDKALITCKEQFIIVSVVIGFGGSESHSNIFIIDKVNKEIEHFEPHGELFNIKTKDKKKQVFIKDQAEKIKIIIKSLAESLVPTYKFIPCLDYCPIIGPQSIEYEDKYKLSHCDNGGGFCAVWSLLYIYLRLLNPTLKRSIIIKYVLDNVNITYILKFITFIDKIIPDIEIEYLTQEKLTFS